MVVVMTAVARPRVIVPLGSRSRATAILAVVVGVRAPFRTSVVVLARVPLPIAGLALRLALSRGATLRGRRAGAEPRRQEQQDDQSV